MNPIVKAWQEKVLRKGVKAPAGHSAASRTLTPEQKRQRDYFLQMIWENDQRIWYLTRHKELATPPDKEAIAILLNLRLQFRAPDFTPTLEQEREYYQATNIVARLIGERRPETIHVVAEVQRGNRSSPLKYYFWSLVVYLIFALVGQGYQAAISRQISVMQTQMKLYLEEGTKLTQFGQDLSRSLSSMCEHTYRYRTAAEQLSWYIFWVKVTDKSESDITRDSSADFENARNASIFPNMTGESQPNRPGICQVLVKAVDSNTPISPPYVERLTQDEQIKAIEIYWTKTSEIRTQIKAVHLVQPWSRKILDSAETIENLLNFLILPTVFAALGALTNATRVADEKFKAMTLSKVDRLGLISRILLGVVSGATVGIVFNAQQELSDRSGLTELGLAFAFGYSVDIFFNLLDGIKNSVGATGDRRPPSS